ncbi:hypothetical protein AAG570_009879 [Ranatra chinensis]|uniref:Methenyltetrahydrofolate synthase domain-containing protein n=1 Tax=Ranatra chinensis TaxID=642074 RepID=A0ABD0Z3C3_9HEMI
MFFIATAVDVTKSEASVNVEKSKEVKVTKQSIRVETWNKLQSANVLLFPIPCTYRIPRFIGEVEATQLLSELEVFKSAKVIKVALDKAHECMRHKVIEEGKDLIAGSPGLREAVFLHVKPPAGSNKSSIRMASSRAGINHLGTALVFNSEIKVDLIIVGSVAVDKTGRRIGKGEGFSDLEFSLLMKLGAISPDATIVTVVHDLQVYDTLPDEVFQPFDVPVDYIVTPTQVIEVSPRRSRPNLMWHLLSNRRVNNIPVIKQLLDREQVNGTKIELKEADSDVEERQYLNFFKSKRFIRRRRNASAPERRERTQGAGGGRQVAREGSAPPATKTRMFRRKKTRNNTDNSDNSKQRPERQHRPIRKMRRLNRPKYPVDFSVKVDGLTSDIRIRDLKAALIERGVRPRDISWRGTKGVAFLHFAKTKTNPETPTAVDDIVASLQGLTVKAEGNDGAAAELNVAVATQVSKIELVDTPTKV